MVTMLTLACDGGPTLTAADSDAADALSSTYG